MKVRRISQFQSRISFPSFDQTFSAHQSSFYASDLGKIYNAIPWGELVAAFDLKSNAKGPSSIFSPRGKVALMFLKHHCLCSDRKLIEQFNGNIHYQIFCDTILEPGDRLSNFKIVSQIRCEIANKLNIPAIESILMEKWRPFMSNLNSITCDATCYESHIRYPTDQKLLFEAVTWVYAQLKKSCKQLKVRMPRTKYKKWVAKGISYSKMKKKTKKKRRALTRGLLRLLEKLTGELSIVEQKLPANTLSSQYQKRRNVVDIILTQQGVKFYEGERPKGAIVSIDKPYLRPIVRGKEIKQVEFGAKVHKLQIDGISFIEYLSYDAFHEGNRLSQTIFRAQTLTHTRVKIVGADAIYATNENRKQLTQANIQTDFKPKGRSGKHSKHKTQLSKMITKERASRLEGSFGTDKEFFLLNKIRARTQRTETLWIFLGIHTSNALKIGKRMSLSESKAA